MTRVFLELSTEHFLKTMKVPVPPKHERSGRSHWSDFGISLKEKIACALKVLDPEEHNRDLKQPRNGLSDKLALHSVDQMHDFMHNLKADADPKEIKRRSEEHTSDLQSLMRNSYAVFCLKKKKT